MNSFLFRGFTRNRFVVNHTHSRDRSAATFASFVEAVVTSFATKVFVDLSRDEERYWRSDGIIPELASILVIKSESPCRCEQCKIQRNFLILLVPGYTPPHRNQVQRKLKRLHAVHLSRLRGKLQTVKTMALTSDFWSDRHKNSFLTITGHYLDSDMNPKSTILHFQSYDKRHVALDIATEVRNRLRDLGIDQKVTSVTCDGAKNMQNAFDMFDKVDRFWCAAHRLHLTLCNGLALWKKFKKDREETTNGNLNSQESIDSRTPADGNEEETDKDDESENESLEGNHPPD